MKEKNRHNPVKLRKEVSSHNKKIITRGKNVESSRVKEASPKNQLASLDAGVKICARKYNDCKAKADKLQNILSQKRDVLTELNREGESLINMLEGKNNGAKQLSKLRSDIEYVTEACEINLHYRLQLNYMYMRQTKISSDMDAVISDLSNRISSMEAKRIQMANLLCDAESNLTATTQEYENIMVSIQKERAYRNQELAIKETEVASARKIEEWRRKQESHITRRAAGGSSDSSVESISSQRQKKRIKILELEAELTNIMNKTADKNMNCKSDSYSSKEASSFLCSLKELEEVATASSAKEIVQKFIDRKDQKQRLLLEKKEAEARYITVKNRLADSQSQLNTLLSTSSCPPNAHEQNRSKLEEIIKKSMDDERLERKAVNSTTIHLADVFIRVQQGAIGLVQKIILHRNLLNEELPILNCNNALTVGMYSCDIQGNSLKILEILNYFLCKMLDDIGGIKSLLHHQNTLAHSSSSLLLVQKQSAGEIDHVFHHLGDDNCRIQSNKSSLDSFNTIENHEQS